MQQFYLDLISSFAGQSKILGHELADPPHVGPQWRPAAAVAAARQGAARAAARPARCDAPQRPEWHLRHDYGEYAVIDIMLSIL